MVNSPNKRLHSVANKAKKSIYLLLGPQSNFHALPRSQRFYRVVLFSVKLPLSIKNKIDERRTHTMQFKVANDWNKRRQFAPFFMCMHARTT